jgi:hypothetical protein
LAALTARDGGDAIAVAADMRNMSLRDVAPTLTRGGQGTSVNSAPSVLVVQNLRRVETGSPPPDADVLAESPADVSLAALTQADVDVIAVTWRWTRMSALLAEDILDGRGEGRADTVDVLREAFLAARAEMLDKPRGLAREVVEAARLVNTVVHRLMMERRAAQEASAAGEPTAWVLDRRNQKLNADVVSTLTAEGEGARQAVIAVQPGGPVTVPVTAEDLRELLGLASQDAPTGRKQAKDSQGKKRPRPA